MLKRIRRGMTISTTNLPKGSCSVKVIHSPTGWQSKSCIKVLCPGEDLNRFYNFKRVGWLYYRITIIINCFYSPVPAFTIIESNWISWSSYRIETGICGLPVVITIDCFLIRRHIDSIIIRGSTSSSRCPHKIETSLRQTCSSISRIGKGHWIRWT